MSLIHEISNNEFAFELFRPWFFWDYNTIFLTWNNLFPGLNCIYPSDFVPFTRRPLFLIIDSDNSEAFKASLMLCIFDIMSFTYIYHMQSNKYLPLPQLSNYIYKKIFISKFQNCWYKEDSEKRDGVGQIDG